MAPLMMKMMPVLKKALKRSSKPAKPWNSGNLVSDPKLLTSRIK